MKIFKNIRQLYTCDSNFKIINNAAVVVENQKNNRNKILWVGREQDLDFEKYKNAEIINTNNQILMPGLIDCHTHLVFAGDRSDEYNLRSKGASYSEILKSGGGILNTVKAVRKASEDELFEIALPKVKKIYNSGVRLLEIKSGYGLNLETELKMLQVIGRLKAYFKNKNLEICPTFLGAHVFPEEFKNKQDKYVDLICNDMLPEVKSQSLAKACDIFIEQGAFSIKQAEKILTKAKDLGFDLQVHAEQLSHTGATDLACELGAKCVGHLEFISSQDISKLVKTENQITAVILPIAQEFLRSKQKTPGREVIDAGARVAVATDYNPGSAMCHDIWWAARLAVACCGLSCEEAILGITKHAAQALGYENRGSIEVGMRADFILLDQSPIQKLYEWGHN